VRGISILPAFFSIILLVLAYSFFTIKKIDCSLNNLPCTPEIVEKLNSAIGSNSIFVNQKKLIDSIKLIQPLEKHNIGFKMLNTLDVKLVGNTNSHQVEVFFVKDFPVLTFDTDRGSTISSDWIRPSQELSLYLKENDRTYFEIWENGTLTPSASGSASIKLVINEKPTAQTVSSLYNLVRVSHKYLDLQEIIVLGNRVFLRQLDQPDIIVNIPFDEAIVTEAFQSIKNLATIKKDAKVIDLRFKNPIIR